MSEEHDKKPEEKEDKEDFKTKWDTERQEREQIQANYEKAAAENQAITEQLEANQLQITELEEQLKAKEEQKTYPELDDELVDKNVIKSITELRAQVKGLTDQNAELTKYAENHKKVEEQRAADANQERLINKMCKPLDEEFGANHRNAARKLAESLVTEGKEKKPEDAIDVMYLMRKCYTAVSKGEKKEESVRTDPGGGGVIPPAGQKKPGTNMEVFEDMKRDTSWREEPIKEVI